MPPGYTYNLNPAEVDKEAVRFETVYRLSGGFNLEDANVPDGTFIPSLAPLCVDFSTRKAVVVKNVCVHTAIAAADTTAKIKKGSLAYVGMFLGNGSKGGQVSAIDKSNAAYDEVTFAAAFGGTAAVGDILFEASAVGGTTVKKKANVLNYAKVKKEAGATVTGIGQAFEIIESKLSLPVSGKDKENLGARFMFI